MEQSRLGKAIVGTSLAASSIGGAIFAARRTLDRWAANPDPLNGVPVHFDGVEKLVTTDDGAHISTRSAGSGRTIVLVHGLTGNHNDWGPIASRLLEHGHRVITIDQRGHGNSTVGMDGYGAARLGQDLTTVFEELDLQGAVVAGHSMGGMAALSAAVDRPDVFESRVDHLVIIASAATLNGVRNQLGLWIGDTNVEDRLAGLHNQLRIGAGLTAFGKRPSLFMVDEVIRSFEGCPDHVRRQATSALKNYDIRDRLQDVDVPTSVVAGTHDLLTPLAGNELLAAEIPGASLEVIEDAGHMIIWESASRIAALCHEASELVQGHSAAS